MNDKIPTHEEHARFVRRIWKICILMAAATFVVTGGIVLALFLGGHDGKKIVEVSTSVFQVVVLSYGLGFFVPAFLTSLITMSLGIHMSRRGIEIGEKTAANLESLQRDVIEKVDKWIDRAEKKLDEAIVRLEKKADEMKGKKVDEIIDSL